MPSSSAIALNTPSAVGERQMLPVKAKRTPVLMFFLSTRIARPAAFVNPIVPQSGNYAAKREADDGNRFAAARHSARLRPMQNSSQVAHGAHYIAPDVRGQNFYAVDRQFQDVLSLYLDAGWRTQMTPHFERLGRLAGGRIAQPPSIPDKHPPVLH